jgi:hypothetical protein
MDHARLRLPAFTLAPVFRRSVLGVVGAIVHPVESHASLGQECRQTAVDPADVLLGDQAPRHPRLVRDKDETIPGSLEPLEGLDGPRDESDARWIPQVTQILDDRPIPIQEGGGSVETTGRDPIPIFD